MAEGQGAAAEVKAERAEVEARVHEEMRKRMRGGGLAVDGGDEDALVTVGLHTLLAAGADEVR